MQFVVKADVLMTTWIHDVVLHGTNETKLMTQCQWVQVKNQLEACFTFVQIYIDWFCIKSAVDLQSCSWPLEVSGPARSVEVQKCWFWAFIGVHRKQRKERGGMIWSLFGYLVHTLVTRWATKRSQDAESAESKDLGTTLEAEMALVSV